jgi:hypothetical protein
MLDQSILDNFTSACASNKIVESVRLGGLPLLMENGTRMIRSLTTPEVTRKVLYVFRDELLRFQRANLDDEKRWKSPERKWRKRKTTDE